MYEKLGYVLIAFNTLSDFFSPYHPYSCSLEFADAKEEKDCRL